MGNIVSKEEGDISSEQKYSCSTILHTKFGLKCTAANLIDGAPGLWCSSPSAKKLNLQNLWDLK